MGESASLHIPRLVFRRLFDFRIIGVSRRLRNVFDSMHGGGTAAKSPYLGGAVGLVCTCGEAMNGVSGTLPRTAGESSFWASC
jgi:hypothetical protein